jgi:hypothetical protein
MRRTRFAAAALLHQRIMSLMSCQEVRGMGRVDEGGDFHKIPRIDDSRLDVLLRWLVKGIEVTDLDRPNV